MTLGLIWCRPGELPLEVTGFVGRQRELTGLAGLRDPGLLPHTVATCLGLPEPDARSGPRPSSATCATVSCCSSWPPAST